MSEPASHQKFVAPVVAIPRGDGSFLVRPGAPISRLSTAEFGKMVGLSKRSIRRYIESGDIPPKYVSYVGCKKILIDAAAVDSFLAHFQRLRGGGL